MLKTITAFSLFTSFVGCTGDKSTKTEKSALHKLVQDSFAVKNLEYFAIDSSNQFPRLTQIFNSGLDTALENNSSSATIYLYSYQENTHRKDLLEFTCLVKEEYRGHSLHYFIVNKSGKLISTFEVAGLNGEDGVEYKIKSHFIHPDTILLLGSITTEFKRNVIPPYKKLSKPIGDSSYYKIVIDSSGTFKKFKMESRFKKTSKGSPATHD